MDHFRPLIRRPQRQMSIGKKILHLRHQAHNAPAERRRRRRLDVADVELNFWCRAVTHQHLHNVQSVFAIECTAEDLDLVPGGCLLLLCGGRGQVLRAHFAVRTPPVLRLAVLRYSGANSLFDFPPTSFQGKVVLLAGEVGVFSVNHHLDGVCVKIAEPPPLLARRETTAK